MYFQNLSIQPQARASAAVISSLPKIIQRLYDNGNLIDAKWHIYVSLSELNIIGSA